MNQIKRDRLVTANLLQKSECRIRDWWNTAYLDPGKPSQIRQFNEEARSSLPIDRGMDLKVKSHFGLDEAASAASFASVKMELSTDTSSVFEAMQYQRLRICQDQNLPEWDGIKRSNVAVAVSQRSMPGLIAECSQPVAVRQQRAELGKARLDAIVNREASLSGTNTHAVCHHRQIQSGWRFSHRRFDRQSVTSQRVQPLYRRL